MNYNFPTTLCNTLFMPKQNSPFSMEFYSCNTYHLLKNIINFGGTLLFQCNYDLKLLDLQNLSVFYKDVLAVWQELNSKDPRNANEYKQEITWNNRFIKIDEKSFYYRSWANKGILKISDLLNTHS